MDPIEKQIAAIRGAHPDMEALFLYGCCYRLFLILRSIHPDAEPWYDHAEGHVYTRIGRCWYDIRGKHVRVSDACRPLDHRHGDRPHRWSGRDRRRLTLPGGA